MVDLVRCTYAVGAFDLAFVVVAFEDSKAYLGPRAVVPGLSHAASRPDEGR